MEVTRQLLTERAGKTGLSRIQLTFCWDSQRLRLGSGQKCHPRDWDAKRELLKAKTGAAGTYVDTVNLVLQTYTDVAHAAHHDAQLTGQRLSPVAMKAEVLRRYAEKSQEQAGLLPIPAPRLRRRPASRTLTPAGWASRPGARTCAPASA